MKNAGVSSSLANCGMVRCGCGCANEELYTLYCVVVEYHGINYERENAIVLSPDVMGCLKGRKKKKREMPPGSPCSITDARKSGFAASEK